MKKLALTICFLVFVTDVCLNVNAQKGFFDLNVSYNKFTQHFDKPVTLGFNLDANGQSLSAFNIDDYVVDKIDLTAIHFSLGYNFHLDNGCYLGIYLGYSQYSSDYTESFSYLTIAPRLTYFFSLTKKLVYSPNCFISLGYCMTSSPEEATITMGPVSFDITGAKFPQYNFRFAINPFSFDYKLSDAASVNLTLLTPMLNLMPYTYDNEDYNQTTKDVVFLYGQVGFKVYLNKKDHSVQTIKNKKRRR